MVFEPGWRWSSDVEPIAGALDLPIPSFGIVLSGTLHVGMDDGVSPTRKPRMPPMKPKTRPRILPVPGIDGSVGEVTTTVSSLALWARFRSTPTGTWGAWTLATSGPTSPLTYAFTQGDGYYEFYSIATDAAGNAELAPSAADASMQHVAAAGWSAASPIASNDGLMHILPAVTMGSDDSAYAVWVHGWAFQQSDIYFSKRSASTGTWSAIQKVNDVVTNDQFEPDVAVDSAGNVYAIWTDERVSTDRNIYFSKRSAATGLWSASVRVNDDPTNKSPEQRMPSISVMPNGTAIAVWLDRRSKDAIYSARLAPGATVWSTNIKVTTNASSSKSSPDVAIGADGTAYATWYEPSSADADIWFASLASGANSWSANVKASDDPGTAFQGSPSVGVDTAGDVLVAFEDWRTNPHQVRVRRRAAGGTTWSPSVVIAANGGNMPSISVRGDGKAVVAWYDGLNSTTPKSWASFYSPTALTWSTAEQISDATASDGDTSAPGLGNGIVVVVYQHAHDVGTGRPNDIYAKTKPFS